MSPGRTFFAVGGAGALCTLAALTVATPATEGCQTQQCDQSNLTIGLDADGGVVGTGEVLPPDGDYIYWESAPLNPSESTWTVFSGQETLTFLIPPDAGIPPNATVVNYDTYVAGGRDAQASNINAAGQLAEYSNIGPTSISVLNDSCQTYYVRVVMQFQLPEAGAPEAVAPPPPDASEASTDAAPE
jgi:hypothetical protein